MFSAPAQTEFWTPMTITERQVKETNLNYFVLLEFGRQTEFSFRPSSQRRTASKE